MIDRITIERIRDAANIVDVVQEFVSLKKRGANYVGLCPFHDDKTPSFYVSPSKGLCKCFACGAGGNVVHFIMKHEQLSYYDALRWLARKYHIEIEERELTPEEKEAETVRESLFLVNEFACTHYQDMLYNHPDGKAIGMQYFRQRGIREDIAKKFRLGYANKTFTDLTQAARKKGYQDKYLVQVGLCNENESTHQLHDRFSERVMFPIINISGKVVGFGGRLLDSRTKGVQQKYINSPESVIYLKRKELYGIYQARNAISKKDCVYIVEGYTDVLSMHQCGIENVVSSSGTALTIEQVRLLHRYTENVTLMYDGDEAGIKAARKAIDLLLAEDMNVKVLLLPDEDDPDSFARKHTVTEFLDFIQAHEENFIRYKTRILLNESKNDPLKRAMVLTDIATSISLIPNETKRYFFLKEGVEVLHVDETILQKEINKQLHKLKEQRDAELTHAAQKHNGETSGTATQAENVHPDDIGASPTNTSAQASPQPASATPIPPTSMAMPTRLPQATKSSIIMKERLLVQALIRYGELIVCQQELEDGSCQDLTVTDYIQIDLQQDHLEFQDALHRAILDEAMAHVHNGDFHAEQYFLSHPDPAISQLAADLITDRYQLSRSNRENLKTDDERLYELIPHLLLDFKIALLEDDLRQARHELAQLDTLDDAEKSQAVMMRIKQLTEVLRTMAKHAGDRVIACLR